MNIAILSRNPALYSTQSLARAARVRHHFVRIIDYMNCDLIIQDGELTISYHGQVLEDIDAIIPRIGSSYTNYGAAVIRQFEEKGIFTTLSSAALLKARDKLSCSQLLASKGLQVPKTIVSNNSSIYGDLLNQFDDNGVVIKLINGTNGIGVVLAHRGGSSSVEPVSEAEAKVAKRASKYLGLKVAGVDMLRSNRGPLILEVNASPGLEGIETTTKVDIAGKIINFIERNVNSPQYA